MHKRQEERYQVSRTGRPTALEKVRYIPRLPSALVPLHLSSQPGRQDERHTLQIKYIDGNDEGPRFRRERITYRLETRNFLGKGVRLRTLYSVPPPCSIVDVRYAGVR